MNDEIQVANQNQDELAVFTPAQVIAKLHMVQNLMKAAMQENHDYGVIPGCGDKPTLLKPGSEKLCSMFRLGDRIAKEDRIDMPGGHREYEVTLELFHIPTGTLVSQGVGTCTTMEAKYRFRVAPKTLTGRPVPREYWDARKENPQEAQRILGGKGFGTKKDDNGQWMITEGSNEKIEHDNPADYYNTVRKMAKKRAKVDATISATAASCIFTQDVEDMPRGDAGQPNAKQAPLTLEEQAKALANKHFDSLPEEQQGWLDADMAAGNFQNVINQLKGM